MKLGLDFDNTLICYDRLIEQAAVEMGYLPEGHALRGKTAVRDALRGQGPEGDLRWQQVQAYIYSDGVCRAEMAPGLEALFDFVRNNGIETWIVSHKTRTAAFDLKRRDFRAPALAWMEQHGFFDAKRFGLTRERVVFADSLEQKLTRIGELGLTHFVDDLEEVLANPKFPKGTEGWLYSKTQHPPRGWTVLSDWEEIVARLTHRHTDDRLAAALQELGCAPASAVHVRGGRNSRCYRVEDETRRRTLFVKQYFRSSSDSRNRLDTEYRALELMAQGGIACVPRPLLRHAPSHSAVYEFVKGEPALQGPLEARDVDCLLRFIGDLQGLRTAPEASNLRPASEASFCLNDLVLNLRARRARLSGVQHAELQAFLGDEFDPKLERTIAVVRRGLGEHGVSPEALLPHSFRILSPSDVGFHNALRAEDGRLVFIDFEYFGWDDPAKLISDFVLQPEARLPNTLLEQFRDGIFKLSQDPLLPVRYGLYLQLFRLKWVMILLNEFLRDDRSRRRLAGAVGDDGAEVLKRQLEKARTMIHTRRAEDDPDGDVLFESRSAAATNFT